MVDVLQESADIVDLFPFSHVTAGGDTLALTNVLARFNPRSSHRLLLLAHWDTRPWSDQSPDPDLRDVPVPGANDGASGTAILLHLASLLSNSPPPSGIDLLLVDGEDYGPQNRDMFLGSREFARTLSSHDGWAYAVLLDMVGDSDPRFPVEAYSAEYAPQVAQRIWGIAEELGYAANFPTAVGARVYDDHIPLNEAGLATVDIIDFEYGPGNQLWHTPDDTPEQVSPETLRMVGELVAELAYRGG
jgi:Zn-dependent M28 family amino/carboxypeptidase